VLIALIIHPTAGQHTSKSPWTTLVQGRFGATISHKRHVGALQGLQLYRFYRQLLTVQEKGTRGIIEHKNLFLPFSSVYSSHNFKLRPITRWCPSLLSSLRIQLNEWHQRRTYLRERRYGTGKFRHANSPSMGTLKWKSG